jgi:hypothetical protein
MLRKIFAVCALCIWVACVANISRAAEWYCLYNPDPNVDQCRGSAWSASRSQCCQSAALDMAQCCQSKPLGCCGDALACDSACAIGDYLCTCGQTAFITLALIYS